MKCEGCGHINPQNSKFCEECGNKLEKKIKNTKVSHSSIIAEELNDIIFTPKEKKDYSVFIFLSIIGVVVLLFFIFGSRSSNSNDPYSASTIPPTPVPFDFSCATLKDTKITGNTYYNQNPTIAATLYNGCSVSLKKVALKVNFYKYGVKDSSSPPLGTEYIDSGVTFLDPGDSYAIKGTINTNVDTSGGFSWFVWIYNAEAY